MGDESKKTTLEFGERHGNTVVIVSRRPGHAPVRIIADTVPPKEKQKETETASG
jgi:hypothetical protein